MSMNWPFIKAFYKSQYIDTYYNDCDMSIFIAVNKPTFIEVSFAIIQVNILYYNRQKVLVIIKSLTYFTLFSSFIPEAFLIYPIDGMLNRSKNFILSSQFHFINNQVRYIIFNIK